MSKDSEYHKIELYFSLLHFLSCNKKWFCRIWRKDWINQLSQYKSFGESYGRTKFEAYRKALIDLNN